MSINWPKNETAESAFPIDRKDVDDAYDEMLAAMNRNPHHSLEKFRPDDQISPEQESTPDEEAARRDFSALEHAFADLGIDLRKERVLEVGSGTGELLRVLRQEGVNATGVDFNPRDFMYRGVINAPLGALKREKIGVFGAIIAKNLFDRDRYGFQEYAVMLSQIDSLLKARGVFMKMGTGDFIKDDLPVGWEVLSGDSQFSVYRKGN